MISIFVRGNIVVPYERLKFPGGEIHVRFPPAENPYSGIFQILAVINNSDDIMELLMVTDALRRRSDYPEIHLIIPYFPYARQDRVCNEGEPLSIKVMANLINAQNYNTVTVYDCHSDVTTAVLDRATNLGPEHFVKKFAVQEMVFVCPDAGARKRVMACAKEIKTDIVYADKIRDTKTGQITDTVVHSGHIGNRDFLIIDDICDGGRTFIELAKKLQPLTNGDVYLYVSHGIFSQGLEVFNGIISRIYCPNVWPDVALKDNLIRI